MDCQTAELMVHRYIRNALDEKELKSFLEHIETCSSCYEELETYFIVHEATRRLDEEDDTVFDIQGLLKKHIKENKQMIRRRKMLNRFALLTLSASALALSGFIIEIIFRLI